MKASYCKEGGNAILTVLSVRRLSADRGAGGSDARDRVVTGPLGNANYDAFGPPVIPHINTGHNTTVTSLAQNSKMTSINGNFDTFALAYGSITVLGGIIGYLKAGSVAS
jgi:hypothetical protein